MTPKVDFEITGKKILVCGHKGMVGQAVMRRFQQEDCEVLTADRDELDLRDDRAVSAWFAKNCPNAVILAAAKVGGILANDTMPVPFLLDNLRIQNAVINAAFERGVEKFLFLGSSCIYPVQAAQPMPEDSLLTGPLEPTNQWYAVAKRLLVSSYAKPFANSMELTSSQLCRLIYTARMTIIIQVKAMLWPL